MHETLKKFKLLLSTLLYQRIEFHTIPTIKNQENIKRSQIKLWGSRFVGWYFSIIRVLFMIRIFNIFLINAGFK